MADRSQVTAAELDAYLELLRRADGGQAFLKIMRGFEHYPVQIVGEADPTLKVAVHGEQARRAAGLSEIHRLPGKHFLQEDNAPAWPISSWPACNRGHLAGRKAR